jgi:hypothetical protein
MVVSTLAGVIALMPAIFWQRAERPSIVASVVEGSGYCANI